MSGMFESAELDLICGKVGNSAMKSKSPTRGPSPSLRNGKVRKFALEGLARLSTDVFSENGLAHMSISEPIKPFAGVVICVTGFSRAARKDVQITTERMGGQYSRDLHLNCTHLVVQNCSGRKYEHAVKHGVHRGLHIVSMAWWEDCVQHYARLDESKYTVLRNHPVGSDFEHQELPEAVGSSNRRKLSSANQDTEAAISFGNAVNSSGGSLKNSSSMSRTPHSSLATDKSSHALAGARFYIDSDLPLDLQLKAQDAAESWGATCVENCSKATHVVCECETISKYIGLNLHLVSPMWVMSARDGFPLRCVQYSADLARDVADLLLEWRKEGNSTKSLFEKDTVVHNSRVAEATLQEREKKAYEAKAGVRRRRGPRMQPCRTLPRPNTPTSLLDSICWVVTEPPATAQVYTNNSGKEVPEKGKGLENSLGFKLHNDRYHNPMDEALGTEVYTKPLTRSESREIVFRCAFLTILFPIDRFSELGPSSRTFFSESGFTKEQILDLVYAFYQEPLSPSEVEAALHTDSKHADRLRGLYASKETDELGYVPMMRYQFIGSRLQFEGLKRSNQDPTSHVYDLWLGS
ncbi:uncharacterized protein [Physcomitrium patens]|uniref:BRCT domain-containing protein n=2 Tax=Physcomitrium patens TaxID=3218 RepID=A0A2K1KVV6_PHYPA|nr:uncharacterized protein LOC112279360 [Physcomitrium patens]PNR57876.1 hypothetical protein PHYPA_004870 [Physcomitrium patens]|eukprot:XP_024369500.1 uncharacterized protein LOC112279360 [Physcomitrella patens]